MMHTLVAGSTLLAVCVGCSAQVDKNSSLSRADCAPTDVCQISGQFDTVRGRCVYEVQPDGTPCDDHDVCTLETTCRAGRCQGTPKSCPARGPCYLDSACDPQKGCIDVPLDGPCVPNLPAVELAGCCSADYTAPITLGEQTLHLIIDSGSTTTAAASSACEAGCEGLSPVYDTRHAKTVSSRPTSSLYGDGSGWEGHVVADTVDVGVLIPEIPYSFAAMTSATQDLPGRSTAFFTPDRCDGTTRSNTRQGIFGLGNAPLASPGATTFMDSVADSGVYDAFSTQFCNTTGRMWLGGYDPKFVDSNFTWVPMQTRDGFYRIRIVDILVDGKSLGLDAEMFGTLDAPPIVDNGTSIMSFPTQVTKRVVAALAGNPRFSAQFPSSMFSGSGYCHPPRSSDLDRTELNTLLPSFALVIAGEGDGNEILHLPPTASYLTFVLTSPGEGVYCATLGDSGQDQFLDSYATILGNGMMRDHLVVFDRAAGRLGFALQKDCFAPDF